MQQGAAVTDRIGLVGAAVSDLPGIRELCHQADSDDIRVSFSSLRADALDDDLVAALRRSRVKTATIASAGNLSNAIDMRTFTMATVHLPATWTAASIGFKVSTSLGGTYLPLYDDDGNLVQIDSPTASKAYTVPAALGAGHFVKLWSQNGSGTNTAQAAERALVVDLKS
jgi:hypothetical protein